MRNSILLLVIILLFANSAKAILPLSFDKYQVEDGLSHNSVWCLLHDSYDFMWFGTSDGLKCFDGVDYRIFKPNSHEKKSLGDNNVHSLYEDKFHNLWVGSNNGVYVFDRKTELFDFFDNRTENGVIISSKVTRIIEVDPNVLWIATYGQGVFIYDMITKMLVQSSIYSSFVQDLVMASNGKVYVTSRKDGLICFEKDGRYLKSYNTFNSPVELKNTEIQARHNSNGKLWFGVGANSFYSLDLLSDEVVLVQEGISSSFVSNIRKIFSFTDTVLWLGGDNGLYSYNLIQDNYQRIDNIYDPNSLSDPSIHDIIRDKEGGIWVSTQFGGINYLSGNFNRFDHYSPLNLSRSISGKVISEFCEDKEGNVWIATEDGGLNYLNTTTNKVTNYKPS
ncbi:MAG: hypothetical protein PF444_08690 [Bacteroidales bacterium]|jgi:ligand-binding sensor domain-containing protein|nr:hypothetical protein [Bacteroidales bacterium]